MPDAEIARHRVESATGKRQMLDLGLAEIDAGMVGLRQRDHARGEVDAGRLRALLARGGRQRSGAAGDDEQLVARPETRGLQQRRDRIGGDRREEIVVALGERVVARPLKCAKSRGIGFRQFGCHLPWPRLPERDGQACPAFGPKLGQWLYRR